jgi:hypothetical protein
VIGEHLRKSLGAHRRQRAVHQLAL